MVSLLVLILILQIAIYLINSIGAKAINDLAWMLYIRLPLSSAKLPREQLTLRNEVLKLKREMHSTSSQDEFAKWAKIRRQHDKKQAEYDEKTSRLQSSRTRFDTIVSTARWLVTRGLQTFLQFWHSKTPVFTYPKGWLPWYIEWILGFPRAPYGAVSVNIWGIACGVVVALVGDVISATALSGLSKQSAEPKGTKHPMKMGAGSTANLGTKKEL